VRRTTASQPRREPGPGAGRLLRAQLRTETRRKRPGTARGGRPAPGSRLTWASGVGRVDAIWGSAGRRLQVATGPRGQSFEGRERPLAGPNRLPSPSCTPASLDPSSPSGNLHRLLFSPAPPRQGSPDPSSRNEGLALPRHKPQEATPKRDATTKAEAAAKLPRSPHAVAARKPPEATRPQPSSPSSVPIGPRAPGGRSLCGEDQLSRSPRTVAPPAAARRSFSGAAASRRFRFRRLGLPGESAAPWPFQLGREGDPRGVMIPGRKTRSQAPELERKSVTIRGNSGPRGPEIWVRRVRRTRGRGRPGPGRCRAGLWLVGGLRGPGT
jgi:hypothetical protein